MPAGTRTAPNVSVASPNPIQTTLHLIDASGDLWTENLPYPATQTLADVEAFAAAYQAATQSSLYQVTQTNVWAGDPDPQNAVAGFRGSISDGVNLLWKDLTAGKTISPRLVAPIEAVMQGNQDIPLLSATEFTALIVAIGTLLVSYNLESAQFTGRRERRNNPVIRA